MADATDEELMQAVASGAEGALRELVLRHQAPVRAFLARGLPRLEDAEEASQDVFLKVSRAARTFNGSLSFKPWLFAVARNVLRDRLRKKPEPPVSSLISDPTAGLEVYRSDPDPGDVRAALESLPRRYRAALSLKYLAGMSYREGARELGLTPRGFETRLTRARILFRRALAREQGVTDDL